MGAVDSNVESIVLVRHGRSTANDDPAVYFTTPDHAIPLSDPENDPAILAAAEALARLRLDPEQVCSWRSTYLRCAQTEALILRRAFGDGVLERVRRRESFL